MTTQAIQQLVDQEVERRLESQKTKLENFEADSLKRINAKIKESEDMNTNITAALKNLDIKRKEQELDYQKRENYLAECSQMLEARENAIKRANKDSSTEKFIVINVGGTKFFTLKSTLSSMSPFFASMFSDKWNSACAPSLTDADGNIFIDRDPMFFNILLNWARDGCNMKDLKTIIDNLMTYEIHSNVFTSLQNFNVKTFIKTLDYLAIDYPPNLLFDNTLNVGEKIKLYWRGDGTIYEGTVIKRFIKLNNGKKSKKLYSTVPCFFVEILYEDGDVWLYQEKMLTKEYGPFAKHKSQKLHQYWHYGKDYGAQKIHKLKTRNHKIRQNLSFSADNSSSDED